MADSRRIWEAPRIASDAYSQWCETQTLVRSSLKRWQKVIKPGDASAADSVHLASWPTPDAARADEELRENMNTTRTVKPNFRVLGKRFGPRTQQVAKMISAADHATLASTLRAEGQAAVSLTEKMSRFSWTRWRSARLPAADGR
jgi:valyl-tRNA synthetase